MFKQKNNKNTAKFLFSILIIGMLSGSLIVFALTPTTFTISQGVYPGSASYTVWRDGSTFYAKNSYGYISSYNTNASKVLNDCLDDLNGESGRILVKAGIYNITNSLVIPSYVTIQGETIDDKALGQTTVTKFVRDPTLQGSVFINSNITGGNWNIILERLSIDGNKNSSSNYAGLNGVNFTVIKRSRLYDLSIYNCPDNGVFLGGSGSIENQIKSCSIRGNNGDGLHLNLQADFHIRDCEFGSNIDRGVLFATCANGLIDGCHIFLNFQGIQFYNGKNIRVSQCRINTNTKDGVYMSGTLSEWNFGNSFIGNQFYDNGYEATSGWSGISFHGDALLTCEHNVVEGNIFFNSGIDYTQTYAVREYDYCTNNTFTSNVCYNLNASLNGWSVIKTNSSSLVRDNDGCRTENWGIANVSSSTYVTVTHGLIRTPTNIIITPIGELRGNPTFWISNIGSSTFAININATGTHDFFWYASRIGSYLY